MIQFFGILIIVNTLIISFWWITQGKSWGVGFTTILVLACLVGLALVFNERAIELSFGKFGTLKAAAQQAVTDAQDISELKKRVESQSATVDLVASEATKAKALSEEVAEKNIRAEEKLTKLDEAITKASQTLSDIESITEFTVTVVGAQNDDRKAFDQLKVWAEDESYPFKDRAESAWSTIFESHNSPISRGGFTVPWAEGFDHSKLTIDDLAQRYSGLPAQLKPALLEYIWKRNDIPKIDRLDFLMSVMENDDSLSAVEYAGRHFTSGTEQKIKPMAVEFLSKWWNEHRDEFKENTN